MSERDLNVAVRDVIETNPEVSEDVEADSTYVDYAVYTAAALGMTGLLYSIPSIVESVIDYSGYNEVAKPVDI